MWFLMQYTLSSMYVILCLQCLSWVCARITPKVCLSLYFVWPLSVIILLVLCNCYLCVCLPREQGRLPLSMPLRLWQCALLPVSWHERSCWSLIKVRNDWHVRITLTNSWIIFEDLTLILKLSVCMRLNSCAYFMSLKCAVCLKVFIIFKIYLKCYLLLICSSFIVPRRTVYFTSFAGFQLWWDGVRKCSPLLGSLPWVGENCQQPAGHRYCAAATTPRCRGR